MKTEEPTLHPGRLVANVSQQKSESKQKTAQTI